MLRIALLAVLLAAPAFAADEDIKQTAEKLAGSDVRVNIVEGIVAAPPASVWHIVSRCADFSKTMPRIAKSVELERAGDENSKWTNKCQVTADLPFPLSDLTSITQATSTVDPGVKYVREWTLVSGDYEINEGSWTVVGIEDGKKSHVRYKLRVKPKIHLPDSWVANAGKGALKDVIIRLREEVKKVK